MACSKTNNGFTLVEVLIALTLLAVMMSLLFGSMKICADSWQKGEDKITQVNDQAVVYQFFQHHLSEAIPLWDDFSEQEKVFGFQGETEKLQFISSFPASAKKSGLQKFTLRLAKDDDEKIILVSIMPFFPLEKGEEWHKEEVTLLRHVKEFSLKYYGQDDPQAEGIWQESWLNLEMQPKLVKIRIAQDDGYEWPEMLIALKSQGSTDGSGGQLFPQDADSADGEQIFDEPVLDQ